MDVNLHQHSKPRDEAATQSQVASHAPPGAVRDVAPAVSATTEEHWPDSRENQAAHRFRTLVIAAASGLIVLAVTALAIVEITARGNKTSTEERATAVQTNLADAQRAEDSANELVALRNSDLESESRSASSNTTSISAAKDAVDQAKSRAAAATGRRDAAEQSYSLAQLALSDRQDAVRALSSYEVAVTGFILLVVIISFFSIKWRFAEKHQEFEVRTALERVRAADQEAVQSDQPFKLSKLWSANKVRLEEYHNLVTSYASTTRAATRAALGAGFVFIAGSGVIAALAGSVASSVSAGAVGAAGAALTAFVVRAIVRNAEASSKEVATFFSHPIRVEQFLTAERLAKELPPQDRPAATLVIVEALCAAATTGGAPRSIDSLQGHAAEGSESATDSPGGS